MILTAYMYREKKEEKDLPASIQRLGDFIKKDGERLITATRNDAKNTRTNRTTITRKQKWEKNNFMDDLND